MTYREEVGSECSSVEPDLYICLLTADPYICHLTADPYICHLTSDPYMCHLTIWLESMSKVGPNLALWGPMPGGVGGVAAPPLYWAFKGAPEPAIGILRQQLSL